MIGASPKLHGSRQVNKQEFTNQNWDIDRSSPSQLHIKLHKPEKNLMAKDIEGASPQCVKFTTKRMGGDPLNPNYKLQSVDKRVPTPPKYIRDHMYINDIEGCRPKKEKVLEIKTRESMKVNDIEGAQARIRHKERPKQQNYDSYDYSDITKAHFISTRQTNPLDPSYIARDESGNVVQIGIVPGSKPQALPPERKTASFSQSNMTKDILGATSGTKG